MDAEEVGSILDDSFALFLHLDSLDISRGCSGFMIL